MNPLNPDTEPVRLSAAFRGLVMAVLGVLVAFDFWSPTDAQVSALLAVLVAVEVALASWTRSRVSPVSPLAR